MPVYEYQCDGCGPFSESRPMAASAAPTACPTCGEQSGRVLSATAVRGGRRRRMRGQPEPVLVKRDPEARPVVARPHEHAGPAVNRPWMIGH